MKTFKHLYIIILFYFVVLKINAQEQVMDTVYTVKNNANDTSELNETESKKVLFFKNKYDDTAQVILRNNAADTLKKISSLSVFHYPKEETKENKPKQEKSISPNFKLDTKLLSLIFWLIVIGFVVFIVVMYVKDNNIKLLTRKAKVIEEATDVDYKNIFEIDFDKEIANAMLNKNYNIAARLGFLKILYKLNKNNLISYNLSKTNFDYQFQLINTKYYNSFMASAFCYDYAWYSGAEIKEDEYLKIKQQYSVLENLI